jgi:hypothetical protein
MAEPASQQTKRICRRPFGGGATLNRVGPGPLASVAARRPGPHQFRNSHCSQDGGSFTQAARGALRTPRAVGLNLVIKYRHGLECLALQHLKRRSTASRDMADPVGIAKLLNCGS